MAENPIENFAKNNHHYKETNTNSNFYRRYFNGMSNMGCGLFKYATGMLICLKNDKSRQFN